MLKKLNDRKINEILEIGIREFASRGPEKARINEIARKADVSVGVLYKYFENKDALFLACVEHALLALDEAVTSALSGDLPIMERAEKLVRAVLKSAREKPAYHILYHEITSGGCREYAPRFAERIEGATARAYTAMLSSAKRDGGVRADMDERLFAFLFDNLLMMLQFSYACDYYKERFSLYLGTDANGEAAASDEAVVSAFLAFVSSALGVEATGDGDKRKVESKGEGV